MAALLIEQYLKLLEDLKSARKKCSSLSPVKEMLTGFSGSRQQWRLNGELVNFCNHWTRILKTIYESRFERSAVYEESVLIQKLSRV